MGTIILLFLIVILCIYLSLVFASHDIFTLQVITVVISIFCSVIIIIMLCSLLTLNSRFKKIKLDHASLEMVINEQRENGTDALERVRITKEIIEMNEIINKNKAYHDNFWEGMWYSEEIGNLEYLK